MVTLTNQETNIGRNTNTSAEGIFVFNSVPRDKIAIEAAGATPVITTESSEIADVKDALRIRQLPLNGRDVTSLFALTPGVEGGVAPRVNGLKVGATEMLLDGVSIIDRFVGGMARPARTRYRVSPGYSACVQIGRNTDADVPSDCLWADAAAVLRSKRMGFEHNVARYTCYRTSGLIDIDGRLDEPSWQAAPASSTFVDIVTGEPGWFDTRVRLLWNDKHLYFGFTAEETDVWGTLTERDSKVYEENDLEIFIAGRNAYYEFEISAQNVIYEVFWIWKDVHQPGGPYWGRSEFDPQTQRTMVLNGVGGHVHPRGERWGFLDWDCHGLRHAVHVDGTLNQRDDVDRGWSAEIAIPWSSLALLADGRSLPPRDGDIWRIDCSRFEKIGRHGEVLDPCAGWSWNVHGHYDSHIPEMFPVIIFSERPMGLAGGAV